MAKENNVATEFKNKLNSAFRALPEDIREHSRRIKYYSAALLSKCVEMGFYQDNPLTQTKKAFNAFKNAVKFHDIGKAKTSPEAYEGYQG